MSDALDMLSVETLRALADALEGGRLDTLDATHLAPFVPVASAPAVASALAGLDATPRQVVWTLRLLARERAARRAARDDIELVWTGPEVGGSRSRDTQVVLRELFERAERRVLIATYVIYNPERVFAALAGRMEERPGLAVRMFVHIDPPEHGLTEADAVAGFAKTFRKTWPGPRLPEVFYDPRTVHGEGDKRPSLHAKCVVVDGTRVLVTSANFTEAAHVRNVEAGVLMTDTSLASALTTQFENLVSANALRRVPGIG